MTTLAQVTINDETWTEISGDMVIDTVYNVSGQPGSSFLICEKSTTPVSGDSVFFVNSTKLMPVTYEGVEIWAKATGAGNSLNVNIQEA